MGNFNSIASVTRILTYLLEEGLNKEIRLERLAGQPSVTSKPLNEIPNPLTGDGLNLFLFQVNPNTAYRNFDLPRRDSGGAMIRNSVSLGVDLHYLLTSYCKQEQDEASRLYDQMLLANALLTLEEYSILTSETLANLLLREDREAFEEIASTDLHKQVESIRISMQNLSIDDSTKIWSSLAKDTPYRTSVVYLVSVVTLDKKYAVAPPLPVQKPAAIYVRQHRIPKITSINPTHVEYSLEPRITISGINLDGQDVRLDFGDNVPITEMPKPSSIRNSSTLIAVTPVDPDKRSSNLGLKTVRVIDPMMMGEPKVEHKGVESNIAVFELVPKIEEINITQVSPGSFITITVSPMVVPKDVVNVFVGTFRPIRVDIVESEEEITEEEEEEEEEEVEEVRESRSTVVGPTNHLVLRIPELPSQYLNHSYPVRVQITSVPTVEKNIESQNYNKIIPFIEIVSSV